MFDSQQQEETKGILQAQHWKEAGFAALWSLHSPKARVCARLLGLSVPPKPDTFPACFPVSGGADMLWSSWKKPTPECLKNCSVPSSVTLSAVLPSADSQRTIRAKCFVFQDEAEMKELHMPELCVCTLLGLASCTASRKLFWPLQRTLLAKTPSWYGLPMPSVGFVPEECSKAEENLSRAGAVLSAKTPSVGLKYPTKCVGAQS